MSNSYYDYFDMDLEKLNIDKTIYNKIIEKFPIIKNLENFMNRHNKIIYGEWSEYNDEAEEIFKEIYELIISLNIVKEED